MKLTKEQRRKLFISELKSWANNTCSDYHLHTKLLLGNEKQLLLDVADLLQEQPDIVYCMDCKYHKEPPIASEGNFQYLYCEHPCQEQGDSPLVVDFTDFCSYGEYKKLS